MCTDTFLYRNFTHNWCIIVILSVNTSLWLTLSTGNWNQKHRQIGVIAWITISNLSKINIFSVCAHIINTCHTHSGVNYIFEGFYTYIGLFQLQIASFAKDASIYTRLLLEIKEFVSFMFHATCVVSPIEIQKFQVSRNFQLYY